MDNPRLKQRVRPMPRAFGLLLTLSLVVAAASFASEMTTWVYYAGHRFGPGVPMLLTASLAVLWLAMLTAGLILYGHRAAWLLLGAGLALWWPFLWVCMGIASDAP